MTPSFGAEGIVGVLDAVAAGLGVGILPLFLASAAPRVAILGEPLEGCEPALWLLAHPESRHLRRIAAVYPHMAEHLRLP